MVVAVRYQEIALGVEDQAGWAVQLAVATTFGSPSSLGLAVLAEDHDAAQPLVGDKYPIVWSHRDGEGPDKLPVLGTPLPEFTVEILVNVQPRNPGAEGLRLVGAVDHVDVAILAQCQIYRITESNAR